MRDGNLRRAAALMIAPAIVLAPLASEAHHSRQEFALDIEVMEGVFESVNWTNPIRHSA